MKDVESLKQQVAKKDIEAMRFQTKIMALESDINAKTYEINELVETVENTNQKFFALEAKFADLQARMLVHTVEQGTSVPGTPINEPHQDFVQVLYI